MYTKNTQVYRNLNTKLKISITNPWFYAKNVIYFSHSNEIALFFCYSGFKEEGGVY